MEIQEYVIRGLADMNLPYLLLNVPVFYFLHFRILFIYSVLHRTVCAEQRNT